MSARGRHAFAALAILAAGTLARPCAAYFEDVSIGARGIAVGNSGLALVRDVTSFYWNPAALGWVDESQFVFAYARPYGVEGLSSNALAVGVPGWGGTWTLAWHRLGIQNVYSEDLFTIGHGRHVFGWKGHRFDVGATFKFGRIGFQPFTDRATGTVTDFGSMSKGSLDLGVMWSPPTIVDFAWVIRDVLQPDYEFIPGSGGGKILARSEFGAAIRWNPESVLTLAWTQLDGRGNSALSAGIEIWFYDVFAIRSGLNNIAVITESTEPPDRVAFAAGVGIKDPAWQIDASALTNRDLGASYRVSVMIPVRFGGGQ